VFPGLSPEENERRIADLCGMPLCGDVLIELEAFTSKVHSDTLYRCARRMVENMATDPAIQQQIKTSLGISD
jgi:hypothetical protein